MTNRRLNMDSIVKKLSEIESAAAAIVDHAEAQKSVLDKEFDAARRRFDEDLEAKTQERIKKIRVELESSTTRLLDSQTGANSDSIEALQKEYKEKHTQYAQEILKRITEV